MALDLSALQTQAEQYAKDLTQPGESGGGDYTPPPKGPTALRLAGYIETGIHTTTWQGNKKTKPRALLIFELSGKNHAPRETEGGLIPYRIEVKEVVGFHEKNNYLKLFQQITPEYPEAKHYVHLLKTAEFRGQVIHEEKEYNGKKVTFAGLRGKTGYTIFPASFEDQETGEPRRVKPGPLVSEVRAFLWDSPSLEQWDSLYIAGTYDDGGSKNKYQEKIKAAENWVGSPMYELLIESGRGEEVNPAPKGTGNQGEPEQEEDEGETPAPTKEKAKKEPAVDPLAGDEQAEAPAEEEEDEDAKALAALQAKMAAKKAQQGTPAKGSSKAVEPAKSEAKAKVATTPAKASTARKTAPAKGGDPLADFE